MMARGISIHGLGKLMLLNGTENKFCYAPGILNYKNDIEELNKKNNNINIIFEQDRAQAHISKANKALLDRCFEKNLIQNITNSPDLGYLIEILWGILK